MFNITSKYFSFLNNKPPAKLSRAYNKGIFLHVIHVRIIVPCYKPLVNICQFSVS